MKGKKIALTVGICLILLAAVWLGGRYGWKLFGFGACEGTQIDRISVSDGVVSIEGRDSGLVPEGYLGCVTRQEGGTLYVGFRFDGFFGMFETGAFREEMTTAQKVEKVILCAGKNQYEIWNEEEVQ